MLKATGWQSSAYLSSTPFLCTPGLSAAAPATSNHAALNLKISYWIVSPLEKMKCWLKNAHGYQPIFRNQKTLAHVGQSSHVWRARKAQTAQTARRLSCTCALSWQPYSAAFCRASSSSWYVPLMFHGKFCRRKTTGIGEKWGQFGQCYCQWLLVWVVTFFKISAQASLSLKFQSCFKWGLDNTILPASHWRACLAALSRSSSCMEHMELEHQINTDPNTGGILVAHRLKKFFGCCHGRNAGVQKISKNIFLSRFRYSSWIRPYCK